MSEELRKRYENFYVILPSDGDHDNTFIDNKPTEFTIPLAIPIDIDDDSNWHVALTELYLPNFYYNIEDKLERRVIVDWVDENIDSNRPSSSSNKNEYFLYIQEGYYSPKTYAMTINNLMRENNFQTRLFYNDITKYLEIVVGAKESITLHPKMMGILGFKAKPGFYPWLPPPTAKLENIYINDTTTYATTNKSFMPEHPCYFNIFSKIYIYCSIIENSHIGSIMAPILRVLHISPKFREEEVSHMIFDRPQYKKIKNSYIKEIKLILRDEIGGKIDLKSGEVLAILHFKKI